MITLEDFNLSEGDFVRVTEGHYSIPADNRTMRITGTDLGIFTSDGNEITTDNLDEAHEIEAEAEYCSHRKGAHFQPGIHLVIDPRKVEKINV